MTVSITDGTYPYWPNWNKPVEPFPESSIVSEPDSVPSPDPPVPTESNPGSSAAGGGTKVPVVFPRFAAAERKRQIAAAKHASNAAKFKRRPTRPVDAREKSAIAVMKAAGMTDTETAKVLKVVPSTVNRESKTPELQAQIARWRELFKAQALEQAQDIQLKAWSLAHEALDNKDAKAFDAVTRGINAMERTAASASGENKPASVNVAVGVQTALSAEERDELLREFRKTIAVEAARG